MIRPELPDLRLVAAGALLQLLRKLFPAARKLIRIAGTEKFITEAIVYILADIGVILRFTGDPLVGIGIDHAVVDLGVVRGGVLLLQDGLGVDIPGDKRRAFVHANSLFF